jgi:muconolactone delta-isomerase
VIRVGLEFDKQVAPAGENITTNSFRQRFGRDELVLRPPYQRNLVWNDHQKSFLIDSILRNLPIPEIYTQLHISPEGDETFFVVDGQQRLNACLEFIDDDLRLTEPSGQSDLDPRWRNLVFSELDPELQARFRGYELVVRKLPDIGDSALREIFRRLNKTVEVLQPQELRHAAYTGPFLTFVERAGSMPVLEEIGVFSAQDYRRRRSDELMAEIALAVIGRAFPNKKEGLDEAFLTYERQGFPDAVATELAARFGRTFSFIEEIAPIIRRSRFRNKSHFYSLLIYLSKDAERLPLDSDSREKFASTLREFSTAVNDVHVEEDEPTDSSEENGMSKAARSYARAVQRAASDRLNRVRREEALMSVLAPLMARGQPTEFVRTDGSWLDLSVIDQREEDEYEDESARASELRSAAATLLRDTDDLG